MLGLITLFIIFLLSACRIDVTTEIYIRDVKDVFYGGHNDLWTPAIIKIGVSSCDDKKELDQVFQSIQRYFEKLKNKSCDTQGVDSLMVMGAELPLSNDKKKWKQRTQSVLGVYIDESLIHKDKDPVVHFVLDRERFAELNKIVEDKFYGNLDFEESNLTFVVNNDDRKDDYIRVADALVDGQPIINESVFKVSRREKLDIKPSNVRRRFFSINGIIPVFDILER